MVDHPFMFTSERTPFASVMKSALKVFGYLFFAELLFNTVYNGHYSFNILVKNVTLSEALEGDKTLIYSSKCLSPLVYKD